MTKIVLKRTKEADREVSVESAARHKEKPADSRRWTVNEPRARAINSTIIPSEHLHYYSHSVKWAINVIRVLSVAGARERNAILMGRGSNSNRGFNDRSKKQRLALIVTQPHGYFSTTTDVSVSNKGYRCRETNGRTSDASSFLQQHEKVKGM